MTFPELSDETLYYGTCHKLLAFLWTSRVGNLRIPVPAALPGTAHEMLKGCALTAAQPMGNPCLTVAPKNGTLFKPCVNDLLLLLIHGFIQHFLILYS